MNICSLEERSRLDVKIWEKNEIVYRERGEQQSTGENLWNINLVVNRDWENVDKNIKIKAVLTN